MKNLLITFLVLASFSVSGQFRNNIYSHWDGGYAVGAYGRYQASSNAVTTNLLWAAYQGKFLDKGIRQKSSNLHSNSNRIGVDLDYGIFAKHIPDSTKGIGWFVKIADRTHINAKYPKDLFDLGMFGNAMFAGETIELSDIRVNYMQYSQFELGLLKNIRKGKGTWNLGFGLSLLTGKRNLSLLIEQADLYTDPDGEYLEGEIHGSITSASLSSAQYFDANGVGFSASVNVGYSTDKFGIRLEADDMGMIGWSKNLKKTDIDSVFVFEGAEVNLFAADGSPFSSISLDTVINGFATKLPGEKYTTPVPGRVRLEGHYMLNSKKWRLYVGVQYRIAPSYVPYVYVGTDSPLGKGFFIDGRLAFGGFGSWHIGLEAKKKFGDVFEVRIGTNNLEGYVLPMVGTSQSAYIGLTGFF